MANSIGLSRWWHVCSLAYTHIHIVYILYTQHNIICVHDIDFIHQIIAYIISYMNMFSWKHVSQGAGGAADTHWHDPRSQGATESLCLSASPPWSCLGRAGRIRSHCSMQRGGLLGMRVSAPAGLRFFVSTLFPRPSSDSCGLPPSVRCSTVSLGRRCSNVASFCLTSLFPRKWCKLMPLASGGEMHMFAPRGKVL